MLDQLEILVIELQAPVAVGVDELCDQPVPAPSALGERNASSVISGRKRTPLSHDGRGVPSDWASVNLNDENVARNRWSFNGNHLAQADHWGEHGDSTCFPWVSTGESDLYAFTVPDDGDYRVNTYAFGATDTFLIVRSRCAVEGRSWDAMMTNRA